MKRLRTLKPLSITNKAQLLATLTTRLTAEQLAALSRCANGISLRFDAAEIVDALIACGYAQRNVAGVVTVTNEGREYLWAHAT